MKVEKASTLGLAAVEEQFQTLKFSGQDNHHKEFLLKRLKGKEPITASQWVQLLPFIRSHLLELKALKLQALKQTMNTCPRLLTDARFYKWSDWILKDNQLLKKDGLKLSQQEIDEAILERGIIRGDQLPAFIDKHSRILQLDSNRKVNEVESILSYGIVMALDQMHLNSK